MIEKLEKILKNSKKVIDKSIDLIQKHEVKASFAK